MAHFAEITDGIVQRILVLDNQVMQDASGVEAEGIGATYLSRLMGGVWVQTSYNTREGEHTLGGTPLRANYCGKGWQYDPELDIFHPQQPYPSWTLDTVKGQWIPPVPYPEVEEGVFKGFKWNEEDQQWDEMEMPSE